VAGNPPLTAMFPIFRQGHIIRTQWQSFVFCARPAWITTIPHPEPILPKQRLDLLAVVTAADNDLHAAACQRAVLAEIYDLNFRTQLVQLLCDFLVHDTMPMVSDFRRSHINLS
jgi:hypothetical protein